MVEIREPGGAFFVDEATQQPIVEGDEVRFLRRPTDRAGVPERLSARCAGADRHGGPGRTGELA